MRDNPPYRKLRSHNPEPAISQRSIYAGKKYGQIWSNIYNAHMSRIEGVIRFDLPQMHTGNDRDTMKQEVQRLRAKLIEFVQSNTFIEIKKVLDLSGFILVEIDSTHQEELRRILADTSFSFAANCPGAFRPATVSKNAIPRFPQDSPQTAEIF